MKAIQALKDLIIADQKIRYPSIPDHCRAVNTFNLLKPEKREKKRIELFLNLSKGSRGTIIENRGQRVDNRKTVTDIIGRQKVIGSVSFIGSGIRNGTADIMAIIKGKAIDIELKRVYKTGKDRQSPEQKREQQMAEEAGGEYWIVKDFDDFYERYLQMINK
jgi:hypothetical protein